MSTQSLPVVITLDRDRQVLQVKWIINDFKNITEKFVFSNTFSHPSAPVEWKLKAYPNGHSGMSVNHLSYFLYAHGEMEFVITTNFSLGSENKNGATTLNGRIDFAFDKEHRGFGHPQFALLKQVNEQLLKPDGSLTLLAEIDYATLKWGQNTLMNQSRVGKDLGLALDGDYTDVVFQVGGLSIKAHKVIIAYRSRYFKAMFDSNSSEAQSGVIEIKDFEYGVVRRLLEFFYSGAIELKDVVFASNLRIAADKYEALDLCLICEDYIVANVDKTTAAKVILSTSLVISTRIREACLEVFKKRVNYEDIHDFDDVFEDPIIRKFVVDAKI